MPRIDLINLPDFALSDRIYFDKYLLSLGINAYLMGDYTGFCAAIAEKFDFTQAQLSAAYSNIKFIVLNN